MDPRLRVDTAGSHGVLRTEGTLRQRREISELLKGNAKVTLGPVGERVRGLVGALEADPEGGGLAGVHGPGNYKRSGCPNLGPLVLADSYLNRLALRAV